MRRPFFALSIPAAAALPASPRVMLVPPRQPATPRGSRPAVRIVRRQRRLDKCGSYLAAMPDPCLVTPAETIAAAGNPPPNEPAMVGGLVVMKRGLFERAVAAAAIQVTTLTPSGDRRLLASVPLHMATATNGRNTPIATVK